MSVMQKLKSIRDRMAASKPEGQAAPESGPAASVVADTSRTAAPEPLQPAPATAEPATAEPAPEPREERAAFKVGLLICSGCMVPGVYCARAPTLDK